MSNKKINTHNKVKNKKSKDQFLNNENSFFNSYLINEILNIIFISISIFLIISIFTHNGGTIGKFLNNSLKILFGIGTYILPFIIITISMYNLITKRKKILSYDFLIYFSIFILSLTLLHILTFYPIKEKFTSLLIIFELCKNRSGILVEILSTILLKLFGKIGSSIILITNIIILIIILTKRSLIELIKSFKNKLKICNNNKDIIINNLNDERPIKNNDISIKLNENYNYDSTIQETENEISLKSNDNITLDEKNNKNKMNNSLNENNSSDINFNKIIEPNIDYGHKFPPIELLKTNKKTKSKNSKSEILENSIKLEETLKSFGVNAKVIEVSKGPTVTRYELSPGQGVKVSKISNLTDDLALNLAAKGIRIEAPIPGKAAVGIEISNKETESVYLRDVIEDKQFKNFPSNLAFALGKDVSGKVIITDLSKMPHLLIAGATGSGKSVCINTLITSLLYKSSPSEVKLIMIDPKVVELSIYNGIPHLMIPVVTNPKNAAGALNWAVKEMLRRYELFANSNVRDLDGYNKHILKENTSLTLPKIVIIIDELSDLMMAAPNEVEDSICRLAQMARAAGLHLIIATQRPSVDVITGIIKANIPSRLAFSVSSGIDSRTILDMTGAEKLLGHGDMLFYPVGMNKPIRIQGAFISDKEVESIVTFLKKDYIEKYDEETIKDIISTKSTKKITTYEEENDELFKSVVNFIIEKDKASASLLQRQFRIGFNKAARLIEILEDKRFISQENGSKPRKVLITKKQWDEINKKEYK